MWNVNVIQLKLVVKQKQTHTHREQMHGSHVGTGDGWSRRLGLTDTNYPT